MTGDCLLLACAVACLLSRVTEFKLSAAATIYVGSSLIVVEGKSILAKSFVSGCVGEAGGH